MVLEVNGPLPPKIPNLKPPNIAHKITQDSSHNFLLDSLQKYGLFNESEMFSIRLVHVAD